MNETTETTRLKTAAEKIIIARLMGWDVDEAIDRLQEVLEEISSDPGEGE